MRIDEEVENLKSSLGSTVGDLSSEIEEKSKRNKVMNISVMNVVQNAYFEMQNEINKLRDGFQEVILLFTNIIPPK